MTRRPRVRAVDPDKILVINRPSPAQFMDRDRRERMPARDLTGHLLGDPPVGWSALDKKLASEK